MLLFTLNEELLLTILLQFHMPSQSYLEQMLLFAPSQYQLVAPVQIYTPSLFFHLEAIVRFYTQSQFDTPSQRCVKLLMTVCKSVLAC